MKDSVELCQRSGRARQIDCAIVVLEERHDRPVAMLREVEIQQENIIRKFDPSCINNQNVTTKMIDSQRQRTLQANKLLNTNNSTQHNCAAALNLYCQKTKANLSIKDKFINNLFVTELIYTSVTDSVSAIGTASNKKFSKEDGAKKLLQKLKERNVGR